jgi:hypothetical protein
LGLFLDNEDDADADSFSANDLKCCSIIFHCHFYVKLITMDDDGSIFVVISGLPTADGGIFPQKW